MKVSEVDAVIHVLDKEWPEGTTSDLVAKAAIKALDDMRSSSWRPLGPPLQVDSVFKHQLTSKTHYVRWIGVDDGRELAWIASEDSEYGSLVPTSSPFWRWTTPVKPGNGMTRNLKVIDPETGEQKIDEDGNPVTEKKFYPPVHLKMPINDIGMMVGDRISTRNVGNYTVLAVCPGGVLLRFHDGHVWAESNHGIQRYYKDGWL